jgi:hypothetical protein
MAVALVGGDGVRALPDVIGAAIRQYPSSADGGNGRHQHALAAIRHGSFALVVILVRGTGHADSDSVRRACRNSGVPLRVVTGGMTSVARIVRAFVAAEGCDVE